MQHYPKQKQASCVSVRTVEDIFQTWFHLSLGGSSASSLFCGHSQPRVPYLKKTCISLLSLERTPYPHPMYLVQFQVSYTLCIRTFCSVPLLLYTGYENISKEQAMMYHAGYLFVTYRCTEPCILSFSPHRPGS